MPLASYDDRSGIAVTISDAAAITPLNQAIEAVLAHRANTATLLNQTLAIDADCALAHLIVGFAQKILAQSERDELARAAFARAACSINQRGGTAREVQLLAALDEWCAGNMRASAELLEAQVARCPTDILTLKLSHAIQFMLGDRTGMHRILTKAAQAWSDDMPLAGYVHGCMAFAFEEMGEFDKAEAIGRHGLDLAPGDVWGAHAVAHTFEMRRQPLQGVAWLDRNLGQLDGCGNFSFHIEWHRGLFLIQLGQLDAALDAYDRSVRIKQTDDFRDISNAASLLWRLEYNGLNVGLRWHELADLAERRITDDALTFARLHYLMAMIGDHRWPAAKAMVAQMQREAATPVASETVPTQHLILARIGANMAQSMLDIGERDFRSAIDRFMPVRSEVLSLGGSNAQRDVFQQMLIAAAVSAGRLEDAAILISEREALCGGSRRHAMGRTGRKSLGRNQPRAFALGN
jgi:tetratricopeptide (TPR) repeat protein